MQLLENSPEDWDVETLPHLRILFRAPFTRDVVDRRAERYVRDVVTRLESDVTGMGPYPIRSLLICSHEYQTRRLGTGLLAQRRDHGCDDNQRCGFNPPTECLREELTICLFAFHH